MKSGLRRVIPSLYKNFKVVKCVVPAIQYSTQVEYKPLDFDNTEELYKNKSTAELRRAYYILKSCRNPLIAKMGPTLMEHSPGFLIKLATKYTYWPHFCGGESVQDPRFSQMIKKLNDLGMKVCMDYSVEGAVSEISEESEKEMDKTQNVILDTINFAGKWPNRGCPYGVVKVTGIANCNLLEKISEIINYGSVHGINGKYKQLMPEILMEGPLAEYCPPRTITFKLDKELTPLNDLELESLKKVVKRIEQLSEACAKYNIPLLVDAEQSWYQPAIDHLCMLGALKYNSKQAIVCQTYQCYLVDALDRLKYDFKFARDHGIYWGHKIVRGAYLRREDERVKALGLKKHLIWDCIEKTHECYFAAMDFSLDNLDYMSFVMASHNQESIVKGTQGMQKRGIAPDDPRVAFAQLVGMGDYLSLALANAGYNIAKYVPFGPLMSVM